MLCLLQRERIERFVRRILAFDGGIFLVTVNVRSCACLPTCLNTYDGPRSRLPSTTGTAMVFVDMFTSTSWDVFEESETRFRVSINTTPLSSLIGLNYSHRVPPISLSNIISLNSHVCFPLRHHFRTTVSISHQIPE